VRTCASPRPAARSAEHERLKSTWVNPRLLPVEDAERVLGQPIEREYTLLDLLKRPDVTYDALMTLPGAGPGTHYGEVAAQLEVQAKYAGYIARQQDEVARQAAHESMPLPLDLDYGAVRGLSMEVRQKLAHQRPGTIGQASRIQGVTPAAISLLLVHLKRRAVRGKDQPEKSAA
jgi:tRNA uridine 5-carboxymethylaminomethyl modification enzyme